MDDNVRLTIGAAPVALGVLDTLVGLVVVAPRIPDEARRRGITLALVGSGAVTLVLGVLFLNRVLGGR